MPKWNDIEKSSKYQELNDTDKTLVKGRFYWETIQKSDKYTSMPEEEKSKVFNEFIGNKDYTKAFLGTTAKRLWQEWKQLPGIKQSDVVVENVAKFIEPEVPAGRTTFGLMTKDLPRQVGADFLRAYKPSTLLPFMGATKVVGESAKPLAKYAWSKVPPKFQQLLTKQFTIGKGQPQAYQEIARKTQLEKAAGAREAEDVAKVLTIAPQDMTIKTPQGKTLLVKKGQPLTQEHQRYIGRIFRQEIDLGGKQSRLLEPVDVSRRIAKNVEVEVAFNPKIQSLNNELTQINQVLRNKEILARGLVGKEFTTETGFIEKATGVAKTPRVSATGRQLKPSIGLTTEPISPAPPTASPIPANLTEGWENIIRSINQVSGLPPTNKFVNLQRKELLTQRKLLSNKLMKETLKVEEGVRTNYFIFDRTFSEQIRNNPRFQELSKISQEGRTVMDKWSNELVKSGIPKEQASVIIQENIGEYMARMYEKHLVKGISGYSPKNLRLRLNGLKHRKDLSSEVMKQMGEIKEPALPTAIRVKEISSSVANNKLFNQVASNPEWTATTNITGNMVQMPKSPNLGALSGKFVVPEIAQDINAITSIKAENLALELYAKSLNMWKIGKVVLNPATHFRNMLSNSMLLDLSGTNHFRQMQLFPRVVRDYLSKGKLYQMALQNGAIGDEFVGGEVSLIKKYYSQGQSGNLARWVNVLKTPVRKMEDIYRAEEQIAKLIKFTDMLNKGNTPSIAALEAQKWLFNYNEIPNAIKVAKQIAPFITFTYKSIPRVAESLVKNPLRVYKYYALAKGFNEGSQKMLNMTPQEFAKANKMLPPWLMRSIGGMPTNLLMPWKDKYGRTQWLNLEYILPLGMAPEIMQQGLRGFVSNPLINTYAELSKNKDFKGQDIIPIGSTKAEAAKIIMEYIYRQLAPSLAPGLLNLGTGEEILKGGYSFEKIMGAIYQKPDYAERTREITPVLFDVLMGLKLTPLDITEAEMFKIYEKKKMIEELNNQMLKLNHPAISPEAREKQTEIIFKKIQRVLEE